MVVARLLLCFSSLAALISSCLASPCARATTRPADFSSRRFFSLSIFFNALSCCCSQTRYSADRSQIVVFDSYA